ncbi:MAG TPA: tetratricopeptide repeat protein [Candidatus Limnocylindria bacterium]|nr:tetratricopeptide repeat protein [Candidatus Limnocylindria bacterium]
MIIIFLLVPCFLYPIFEHDRAIVAARQGDWAHATRLMNTVITDTVNDPNVMYDAGVAAYKQEHYDQAHAYFTQAVNTLKASESSSGQVHEEALFNLGNSNVKRNALQEALVNYQEVLALNPGNQKAQHNLELVKKMLEQQKNQEQEKEKEKKSEKEQQQQDKQDKQQQDKQQDDIQQQDKQQKDSQQQQSPNNKSQSQQNKNKTNCHDQKQRRALSRKWWR